MLCCPSALVRIRAADRRCPATSSVEAGTVETMGEPDLQPASYLTLPPGTPVVDRFGQRIGRVERVLLHAGGNFDGIIVSTAVGTRFVDAPEVRRISKRAVALGIAEAYVKSPSADRNASRGGVPAVRWDRTDPTEADRDEVIDSLKAAFVRDELSAEELGRRVETAHIAETLDELDAALTDLTLG